MKLNKQRWGNKTFESSLFSGSSQDKACSTLALAWLPFSRWQNPMIRNGFVLWEYLKYTTTKKRRLRCWYKLGSRCLIKLLSFFSFHTEACIAKSTGPQTQVHFKRWCFSSHHYSYYSHRWYQVLYTTMYGPSRCQGASEPKASGLGWPLHLPSSTL